MIPCKCKLVLYFVKLCFININNKSSDFIQDRRLNLTLESSYEFQVIVAVTSLVGNPICCGGGGGLAYLGLIIRLEKLEDSSARCFEYSSEKIRFVEFKYNDLDVNQFLILKLINSLNVRPNWIKGSF